LYAAASFCRIRHIYYFLLKGDKRDVLFEDLDEEDYEYIPLPGFTDESLFELGRRSYLELILYLKEVEDLVSEYADQAPSLAEKADQHLRFAVRNYFEDDYRGAIRSAGALLEMLAESLYRFWEEHGQLSLYPQKGERGRRGTWAYHTAGMSEIFRRLQYLQEGDSLDGFDESLLNDAIAIATMNDLLEAARSFRNLASHTANLRYRPTKRDAKFALDIALNALEKSRGTRFFVEKDSSP
jgi:hypothetical protein